MDEGMCTCKYTHADGCIHTHSYDRHNPKLSPGAAAAVAIAMAPKGSSEDRDWQGDLSLGYRV